MNGSRGGGSSRRRKGIAIMDMDGALEFLNRLATDTHFYHVLVPLIVLLWAIETWVFSLSRWVLLVVAVWASFQYGSYQRKLLAEDLNRRWRQAVRDASPTTALESCEWLNMLLRDIWPNFINHALSARFFYMVEKRLKHRKPRLIDKVELQEFSLGSCPPSLGLHGVRWSTYGTQRIMHLDFDWDTTDMSIMLHTKLAKPLGTARIVVNSLHIKGDLQLMPILDGKAILYSFLYPPELTIGVAFGSGGRESLPATELPGVSPWLVKVFSDTLVKTVVEPRRRCLSLTAVNLRKKAVGGIVYVTVVAASQIARNSGGSPFKRQRNYNDAEREDPNDLQTFVEVELEELTRKTDVKYGSDPKWDSTFNLVLHDDAGIIKFSLYECSPGSVKCDCLASCEIKFRYCDDNSTIFWAVGPDSSVIAMCAERCGEVIMMSLPFEGLNSGELLVRLVLKEWQFSDGSHSLISSSNFSHQSLNGSVNFSSRFTGRKICITVMEAKDLVEKDRSGKHEPYVKLQYGKAVQRTRSLAWTTNPVWNQKFEFEEIGSGEYLKLKCLYEETFSDENIGVARVNLEGLMDGVVKDVWIPLEKVKSGELRLQIEAVRHVAEGNNGTTGASGNDLIELVVIEAKDLVAADLRGTSDPYVRIHCGNIKRKTKTLYKTLNPQWNETFEFPEDGSPLSLFVKDYNTILAASSIGECVVDYQSLPPNQPYDKWIPLQGVKTGEIHIQITRRVQVLQRRMTVAPESASTNAFIVTAQMKQLLMKLQTLVGDSDLEGLTATLSELESLEDTQEECIIQLENERTVLLSKINDLGQELLSSSPHCQRSQSS